MLGAPIGAAHATSDQAQFEIANPQAETAVNDEYDRVTKHVQESLSPDLLGNFNLFVYVDKADTGTFAQRMYVLKKADDGSLAVIYDWPVSTGREMMEVDEHGQARSTGTPIGFYELDPLRFYVNHQSSQWNEPMPYAMFFLRSPDGHPTGLAIHGAVGVAAEALGRRASAGCVHLSVENAHALHDLIRSKLWGQVPRLAYGADAKNADDLLFRDSGGNLRLENGYSVLIFIDDFDDENALSSTSKIENLG